jgi:8-hydroxy-5-deazaflavin:NADPH oxidoreductase
MRIGILGSGRMGAALGQQWAAVGHSVTFSYSRDPRRLEALARATGGNARAGSPAEAVEASEVVLVAVPWHRLDDALAQAGSLAGKIVVTCSVPMTEDDSDLAVGHTSSGAEELAARLPEARVVAAFNTIPSELIVDPDRLSRPERPEVVYCGDDPGAKQVAADLIRDTEFEPVDAGPLRVARWVEPFALLVAQLAYEMELGPEVGYRFLRP